MIKKNDYFNHVKCVNFIEISDMVNYVMGL